MTCAVNDDVTIVGTAFAHFHDSRSASSPMLRLWKLACRAGGRGLEPRHSHMKRGRKTRYRRPAVMERSWNAAAEPVVNAGKGQDRGTRATSDQRRPARAHGKPRRGTVTPEVAGSSPVAPVSRSPCTSQIFRALLELASSRGPSRGARS
jgi:hypothetical protein